MRIIHTSDWHLGNRILDHTRNEEHRAFLAWLIELMHKTKPDVLLVSGDIFDSSTPSDQAQTLYHDFLSQADSTGCHHIIITGGNHDGVTHLQMAVPLLRRYHTTVISKLDKEDKSHCLIPVENKNGETVGLVCAVPYLREQDTALISDAADKDQRATAYTRGVAATFAEIAQLAREWKTAHPGLPVVAMGHQSVAGAQTTASTRHIIGTVDVVGSDIFDPVFDYVALGHIHKGYSPDKNRICYCGSPLAMGMDEAAYQHHVLIVDSTTTSNRIEKVEVPRFIIFMDETCHNLEELSVLPERLTMSSAYNGNHPIWMQLNYTGRDLNTPALRHWLDTHIDKNITPYYQAFCSHIHSLDQAAEERPESLSTYTPLHLFNMSLEAYDPRGNLSEENVHTLHSLFQQVMSELPTTSTPHEN